MSRGWFAWVMAGLLALGRQGATLADPAKEDNGNLIDESEYGTQMEEIVVTAKKPGWRKKEEPEWRKEDMEPPPDPGSDARMQWFPRYSREDRDRYDGVRDRMAREPEVQLFKFRF